MNKIKYFLFHKKINVFYLIAFFLPVLVMLSVFLEKGIYPFGDRSFLRTDLYHQYAPFFKELHRKLTSGGSLLYSWNIGSGTNFIALGTYYLATPLNALVVLFGEAHIIEFITYFIVFKIGLCGATMTYYLEKHTALLKGAKESSPTILMVFAGCFYALSGYMAAYSWNIMWLDCIFLFPLIILGLEKLVYEDKCFLYCITLGLAIFSNYYIAIMICITLVFYFIGLLYIVPNKRSKIVIKKDGSKFRRTHYLNYPKKIAHFAIYSLIAGGMSACLILPELFAMQLTYSADSTFPKSFSSYFSMIDMISRHLPNVDIHLGLDHWPNIFCGVAILMLIPLYIMNKKYNYREKIFYCIMCLFFYASFSMNFLNFIWHGFHYPNSLPSRQSFAYIFIVLVMAYKGLEGLKDRSIKQFVTALWIAIGFVILAEELVGENYGFHFSVFYVSILFLALYGLTMYLWKRKIVAGRILALLAVLLIFTENYMNTTITSVTTVSRPNFVQYDESYKKLVELAKKDDELFFRMEKFKLRTKNDGAWYGYPTISVFSSMANSNMTAMFKKLGMESSANAYGTTGRTALVSSLYSVLYTFSSSELPAAPLQSFVAKEGSIYMYKNLYTLPLGFMLPSDFDERWNFENGAPIDVQNSFAKAAADVDQLYERIPSDVSGTSATITPDKDCYIVAYVTNPTIDKVAYSVGESANISYSGLKRRFLLDVGYVKAGETVFITTEDDADMGVNAYSLNEEKYIAMINQLSSQGLHVTSFEDTKIKGDVSVETDGLFLTSIPYEKGWTVKVDGEEVETYGTKDIFLSFNLSAGAHTIEFSYMPDGFPLGLAISGISLFIFITIVVITGILKKKNKGKPINSIFIEDTPLTEEEILALGDLIPDIEPIDEVIKESDVLTDTKEFFSSDEVTSMDEDVIDLDQVEEASSIEPTDTNNTTDTTENK